MTPGGTPTRSSAPQAMPRRLPFRDSRPCPDNFRGRRRPSTVGPRSEPAGGAMGPNGLRDPHRAEGAVSSEQAASQIGTMVADRVRTVLESAERAAADLRRRALDQASADREAVHGTAALVSARIDLIEAEVGQLLQELRDEVASIVAEADRAAETTAGDAPATAAAPPIVVSPPDAADGPDAEHPRADAQRTEGSPDGDERTEVRPTADRPAGAEHGPPPEGSARRGRSRMFRRRRTGPPPCGVCGRRAQPGDEGLDRWYAASGTSLCPECQTA